MQFIAWMITGALTGCAASALLGTRNRGDLLLNVVIGIVGILSGGWLLGMVIGTSAFGRGDFALQSLLVSLLGAAVLLAGLQELRTVVAHRAAKRHGTAPTTGAFTGGHLN